MTATKTIREFQLKIAGETRTVKAVDMWGDGKKFVTCDDQGKWAFVALVRFRTGTKLWPQEIHFWLDEKTGDYKPSMQYTHLNRCATFVCAWNDEKYAEKLANRTG